MDHAHEQVAHLGSLLRLIEQAVLAVQNGFLQGALDDVRVQRRPGLLEEEGQPSPVLRKPSACLWE
jgi:hypothetical protein